MAAKVWEVSLAHVPVRDCGLKLTSRLGTGAGSIIARLFSCGIQIPVRGDLLDLVGCSVITGLYLGQGYSQDALAMILVREPCWGLVDLVILPDIKYCPESTIILFITYPL